MSAHHTPGPWHRDKYGNLLDSNGRNVLFRSVSICCAGSERSIKESEANTDLAMAAPDLLSEIELEYTTLADFHNQWEGRHTTEGQAKLCRLRDLICKATGRGAQDVQDDYGMRNAIAAQATGSAA